MRYFFLAFIVLVSPAAPAQSLGQPFVFDDGQGNTMPYRLFVPPNLDPEREYPLVLFLHGAGECGADNLAQVANNIGSLIAKTQSDRFASYLVAPQTACGDGWSSPRPVALVDGILAEVEASYAVDPRRLYVTGLSMGGFGTFAQIYSFPERFAAAVPIASGAAPEIAPAIVNIPIWVFHGSADTTVSPDFSRGIVAALRDAGGSPRYTEYPGVGHDSWSATYLDAGDTLYPWLFSRILGGPQARFSVSTSGGAAPLEVCVNAGDSVAGDGAEIIDFDWDFGDGGTAADAAACHTYMEAGRREITLRVESDLGFWDEGTATVLVHCDREDVTPWSAADIGEPLLHGAAQLGDLEGRSLTLCAGGKFLSGTEESLHFVYQQIEGDITLSGRVSSLEGASASRQVGVMFRESLAPNARCAAMTFRQTLAAAALFQYRDAPSGTLRVRSGNISGAEVPNIWLRVTRRGEEIIGYTSTDGVEWTEVSRRALAALAPALYAGVIAIGAEPTAGGPFDALQTEIGEISFYNSYRISMVFVESVAKISLHNIDLARDRFER